MYFINIQNTKNKCVLCPVLCVEYHNLSRHFFHKCLQYQEKLCYQDASSRSPRFKIFIQFSTHQIYVKYNTSKYQSVPPYKEKKSHSSPFVMAGLNEQLVDEENPLDEDN